MYYNDYGLNEPNAVEGILRGASVAVIIGVIFIALIALAVCVLMIVANCKIFKKAGETWWKGLIPIYNSWVETKIAGLAWWWFLIFAGLTAVMGSGKDVNYVISMGLLLTSFNYNYNMAKKFGKSNGFAVLCTILPIIGLPILAFGSATYNKETAVDKNGIFSTKNW